ncbi:NAD(P)/FAD-dependent oxidoreductase [Microbispora catharanthi]|uniref:FAD-dependent oxidoreductase n=1 Tax=Microbispora catharanthi TaxID=1712871 RepID=A0A5N6C5M8_9ACTN|nr:FAD-dependent oxidoreductase [Microbispora catharanthi]KAB8188062.1 FAD-dependent oxidoreductase [Microbispora catharanthi]
MTEHNAFHKVVVIGGGYAGTVAANHLRMRDDIDITLVNSRPTFVERIRLHQFVAGNYDASVDYGTLLGDGIELVVDNATRIDTASRTVKLASGRALDYDYVIYAVGSTGAVPSSVPGAAEFAYSIAEFEVAQRLRDRLAELPANAVVTVVGGGLTGIETAAELAEQGRKVTLVAGRTLAPTLSAPGRRSVATWLSENDVTVLEGTAVAEVRQNAVVLTDGAVRQSALTIWTAGFGVPGLAAASGLPVDELGRLLTDETLASVDDDRIVAAGDAGSPSGRPLRMSCQAAIPLGVQAADTVLSRIAGTAPAVLDQGFKGVLISLGRHAGIKQLVSADDTPLDTYFDGQEGAQMKEEQCRKTVMGIGMEARNPGTVVWYKPGPRLEQMAAAR